MQKIIEEIRDYVHSQWTLGKIHGISHWDRVYENGQRLLDSLGDRFCLNLQIKEKKNRTC